MNKHLLKYFMLMSCFSFIVAPVLAQEDETIMYELVWDYEAGSAIDIVEWHPSGDLIAGAEKNNVIFIDSDSGDELHRIEVDDATYVADMAWNHDGSLFAAGDTDGWIHIYDDEWEEISLFLAPWFFSMDWHPTRNELATVNNDTETLATERHDGEIRIWNVEGEIIEKLSELPGVISVEYSPDGRFLLGLDWYLNAVLWDTETYSPHDLVSRDTEYRTLSDGHFAQSIAWSQDNEHFALISKNNMEDINHLSFVICQLEDF